MFVVTVVFTIAADHLDAFLPLIRENARASVAHEPGCHQFDVCQNPDLPGTIFLYEVYDDASAFEAHKATPHYATFDAASAALVESKAVAIYNRL